MSNKNRNKFIKKQKNKSISQFDNLKIKIDPLNANNILDLDSALNLPENEINRIWDNTNANKDINHVSLQEQSSHSKAILNGKIGSIYANSKKTENNKIDGDELLEKITILNKRINKIFYKITYFENNNKSNGNNSRNERLNKIKKKFNNLKEELNKMKNLYLSINEIKNIKDGEESTDILEDEELKFEIQTEVKTVAEEKIIENNDISIHINGFCINGENGFGGWAAWIVPSKSSDMEELRLSGSADDTTNIQMELTAINKAVEKIKNPANITIISNLDYIVNVINNKEIKEVNNDLLSLWKEFQELAKMHNIKAKNIKTSKNESLN